MTTTAGRSLPAGASYRTRLTAAPTSTTGSHSLTLGALGPNLMGPEMTSVALGLTLATAPEITSGPTKTVTLDRIRGQDQDQTFVARDLTLDREGLVPGGPTTSREGKGNLRAGLRTGSRSREVAGKGRGEAIVDPPRTECVTANILVIGSLSSYVLLIIL